MKRFTAASFLQRLIVVFWWLVVLFPPLFSGGLDDRKQHCALLWNVWVFIVWSIFCDGWGSGPHSGAKESQSESEDPETACRNWLVTQKDHKYYMQLYKPLQFPQNTSVNSSCIFFNPTSFFTCADLCHCHANFPIFNKKLLEALPKCWVNSQHNTHLPWIKSKLSQVSISEANISAVHRRTRSLQKRMICDLAGFFVTLIWREKPWKNPPGFFDFLLVSPKKIWQKDAPPFLPAPSNGSLNPGLRKMASIWHLFEGPGFFLLFSIHQVFILIKLHPPLVEKDCEWLTQADALLQSKKPNRSRYSTKNLTWNSEHMMIFSKKKNISFFQLALFFPSPILNVCQFISEQRCNIHFL